MFDVQIPSAILVPLSGSKDYPFYVMVTDASGDMVDPDADTINLTITNLAGDPIFGPLVMTKVSTGLYSYEAAVDSDIDAEIWKVLIGFDEGGNPRTWLGVTEAVQSELSNVGERVITQAGWFDEHDVLHPWGDAEEGVIILPDGTRGQGVIITAFLVIAGETDFGDKKMQTLSNAYGMWNARINDGEYTFQFYKDGTQVLDDINRIVG